MQLELLNKNTSEKKVVNVASVPQRSPFRYPGGKTWFIPTLRKWLNSSSQKPKVLVEPFAGGGIVGLTAAFENLVEKVVMVELDEDVAAVWEVLIKGDFEGLSKRILKFDLTHENAQKCLDKAPNTSLDRAFQTILKNRVSHGGIMAPGAGLIKNGENGKGISSRWYPETLAKRIHDIGQIRHKIEFIQDDAFNVIPTYTSNVRNRIFIDPPYTAAGKKAGRRLYKYHHLDHENLFDSVKKSKADFLFTYDESEGLKTLANTYGYKTALIAMKNTHHAKMEELLVGRDLSWLTDN